MQTQQNQTLAAQTLWSNRPIACRVNVTTANGSQHAYHALAQSTCTAVIHALDRFGPCKIRVQAIRRNPS